MAPGGGAAVTAGQVGLVDEAFGFTGRYFDNDTGLSNNLNRWYDPSVGHFLSEDPIGFAGGDANLYRYVGNSPTMSTDPYGFFPVNGWPGQPGVPGQGFHQETRWESFRRNYWHYVNPFVDHHAVDWGDTALQGGTRFGQVTAVASVTAIGAVTVAGVGGVAVGTTTVAETTTGAVITAEVGAAEATGVSTEAVDAAFETVEFEFQVGEGEFTWFRPTTSLGPSDIVEPPWYPWTGTN